MTQIAISISILFFPHGRQCNPGIQRQISNSMTYMFHKTSGKSGFEFVEPQNVGKTIEIVGRYWCVF